MKELHIKGLSINWDKIASDSYLRGIESIAGISDLTFNKPITFFVGENGSGKSTLLEAIAVAYGFNPEGGTRNYNFSTYDSHSELCDAMRLIRGYNKPGWGYFLRAESFIMLPVRKKYIAEKVEDSRNTIIKNPTARVFLQWHRVISKEMVCICLTSLRLRYLRNAN